MKHWIDLKTLEGDTVTLVLLQQQHSEQLLRAASDGALWELWYTTVPSHTTIDAYIDEALAQYNNGMELPFVVLDKNSGTIIGTTRYYNIQPKHRRLEIGYTWYAKSYQRTYVNTECKLLLLRYAFETLHCIAVQFMTNWHNLPSRTAIARLGAHQDGILRHHRLNADGSYRDTVVFSITDQDWPNVKRSLEYKVKTYQ